MLISLGLAKEKGGTGPTLFKYDLVHSATLQAADTGELLGCVVYSEAKRQYRFYAKIGRFDECNLDRSGRWTVSVENIGVPKDLANRIFDNDTGGKPG